MSNPYSEIPLLPSTCLGLDEFWVIRVNPAFFAALAAKVKENGGRVVVIVQRQPAEHAGVLPELEGYGLRYDAIGFLPNWLEALDACPYPDAMRDIARYLWHKVRIAEEHGVTHYVDDCVEVRNLFRALLPNVALYDPRELCVWDRPAFLKSQIPPYIPPPELIPTLVYAQPQGMTQWVECDLSTTPPTYKIG
jgi:hypothetical protein